MFFKTRFIPKLSFYNQSILFVKPDLKKSITNRGENSFIVYFWHWKILIYSQNQDAFILFNEFIKCDFLDNAKFKTRVFLHLNYF